MREDGIGGGGEKDVEEGKEEEWRDGFTTSLAVSLTGQCLVDAVVDVRVTSLTLRCPRAPPVGQYSRHVQARERGQAWLERRLFLDGRLVPTHLRAERTKPCYVPFRVAFFSPSREHSFPLEMTTHAGRCPECPRDTKSSDPVAGRRLCVVRAQRLHAPGPFFYRLLLRCIGSSSKVKYS